MLQAPVRIVLTLSLLWNAVRPGVWHADVPMASDGPLSAVHAIVVRLDPSQLRFNFATGEPGQRWTVERMPSEAVVAFNTGQFDGPWPWGWVVEDGIEAQPPGAGSVVMSFVVDSTGRADLVTPNELPAVRGHVQLAFQSYPALLTGVGEAPWELQAAGRGVDLQHRDSRLALGILGDDLSATDLLGQHITFYAKRVAHLRLGTYPPDRRNGTGNGWTLWVVKKIR